MRVLHLANHLDRLGNGIVNAAVDLAWYQAKGGHDVSAASSGGAFVDLLERVGVRHHPLPQREGPLTMARAAAKLHRLVAEVRPDVVHAHMVTGALLARTVRGRRRFALVCSVQNEWQRHATLMRVGDAVVAVSEANAVALQARGFESRKLHVVPNGTLGSPRLDGSEDRAELQHPAITTVAGLYERKGLPELVTAFERLPARFGAHLYIVGEGPYRPELEARVRDSAAGDRIHLEGFQSDAMPYLRATDIFVLASRKDPFPLVLSEARAAGCAIVGTDVDGIPEALERGRAGLLVPPRDADALARALEELLADEDHRRRLSAAAAENLDWLTASAMADRMDAVYESARRAAA